MAWVSPLASSIQSDCTRWYGSEYSTTRVKTISYMALFMNISCEARAMFKAMCSFLRTSMGATRAYFVCSVGLDLRFKIPLQCDVLRLGLDVL